MKDSSSNIDLFAVIILNWNGAIDTIECIESILSTDERALLIIIDNASTDNSLIKIKEALLSKNLTISSGTFEEVSLMKNAIRSSNIILIEEKENHGFAKGCNLGLKIASAASIDVSVFLNNDTIIEHNALSKLVNKLKQDTQWFSTLPLLTIHNTDRIWNCGGNISRLGFRRYNYANTKYSSVKLKREIPCTFFTGCCFAVRTKDFMSRNGFSERFFFGEEDFELSLWMKDNNLRALCISDSVVHHKVSTSFSHAAGSREIPKTFIYLLNRLIHMRLRFGSVLWIIWLLFYLPYLTTMLLHKKILSITQLPKFFLQLLSMAKSKDCVNRDDFEFIMRSHPW